MLENSKAPRIRRIAALAKKKDRLNAGLFLVEGPQAVRELLLHDVHRIRDVFATTGNEPWQFELDRLADAAGVEITRATEEVIASMSETVQPQGVIAVAEIAEYQLDQVLEGANLVAILHEVRDPGNAGTVLRAADAAGADAVVFAGASIDPWHPKVVRSTTGSLFHLPVAVASSLSEVVGACSDRGLEVIAADVNGDDLTPGDPSLSQPIAWLFGNEARGLTDEDRSLASRALRLPIYGKAESLNLATAASVCLYTTAFAQRAVNV